MPEDKDKIDEQEKCNKAEPEAKPEEDVKKMEDVEDEEEPEEGKKKKKEKLKAKKGEGSAQDPAGAAANSNADAHTLSPGADVPSKPQDVFVPQSSVEGKREQETPMGKSFEDSPMSKALDLKFSALLDRLEKSSMTRLESLAKSQSDQIGNLRKELEATKKDLEKFYSGSFYKAAAENVAPESTQTLSIQKQLEMGNVRFRNK